MCPELAKNTASQNHPQNSTFCSVRGSDSWCIGHQSLYFHEMTLSKVIRAQEGFPTPQSGSPTTKMTWIGQKHAQPKWTPKTAHSTLPGDTIAVTLVANHSVFVKWPWVKLLELKRGFLHHKVASRPQKWPGLAKNTLSHSDPQNRTFGSVKGYDRWYIGSKALSFH